MTAAPEAPARRRILDHALVLMADQGASATSMRQLALACGVNVATLYHYFPSKDALLDAVIADRNYASLVRTERIPVDVSLAPRPRLVQLLELVWGAILAEKPVWKLLVGETLRGEAAATAAVRELGATLEPAVERWLVELFPEVTGDRRGAVASVLTSQFHGLFLEELVILDGERRAHLARRAEALSTVVFPLES